MKDILEHLRLASTHHEKQAVIDQALADGDVELSDCALNGLDLSQVFLNGKVARHGNRMRMAGVDFRGSVCRGADFPALTACRFDGAIVSGAQFGALDMCSFENSVVECATFAGPVTDCRFGHGVMSHVRFGSSRRGVCTHARNKFDGATMVAFDAAGAHFDDCTFAGSNLTLARLSGGCITRCDMCSADLRFANLVGCTIEDSTLRDVVADGSLVTSGNFAERVQLAGGSAANVRVFGVATHETAIALEAGIAPFGDVGIKWRAARDGVFPGETVFICRLGERYQLSFLSSETGELVRGSSASTLAPLLADVAADHADWEVLIDQLKIDGVHGRSRARIRQLARRVLGELFDVMAEK